MFSLSVFKKAGFNVIFNTRFPSLDPVSSGGFAEVIFSVSDGVNMLLDQYLRIFPQPLQLISVQSNDFIEIHPSMSRMITPGLLAVSTNDDCSSSYSYKYDVMRRLSSVAQIQMKSSFSSRNNLFYDKQLKDGQVSVFAPWKNFTWPKYETVNFEVSIVDKPPVTPIVLSLKVKLDFNLLNADFRSPLLTNKKFTVYQNEVTYISNRELDASNLLYHEQSSPSFLYDDITYVITSTPRNGFIGSGGQPRERFSQLELNSNKIYYNHTKALILSNSDTFKFNVTVPKASGGRLVFIGPSFNISIVSRDHSFAPVILKTRSPKLRVVQNYFAIVNSSILRSEDKDTASDMIQYRVSTQSTAGYFAFVFDPQKPITAFTQADVNNNILGFYSKSNSLVIANFDMMVQDLISQLNPNTQVSFSFDIIPVEFELVVGGSRVVNLEQADWKVPISQNSVFATTNANPSLVTFKLVRRPQQGDLLVNGSPAYEFDKFSSKLLENNKVAYAMHKKEDNNEFDSFTLQVSYDDRSEFSENIDVDIRLLPLFNTFPLYIQPNSSAPITERNLNATMLSKKTGEFAVFKVLEAPRLGYLYNTQFEREIETADFFDGNSVAQNQIEYHSKSLPDGVDDARDQIVIRVSTSHKTGSGGGADILSPRAQWVTGKMSIIISTTPYVPTSPNAPSINEFRRAEQNKDLIAILIPVILFLILFCLIGVFLMRRQQRKRNMPPNLQAEKSPGSMATPIEYSKNGMFMPLAPNNGKFDSNDQQMFPLLGVKNGNASKGHGSSSSGGPLHEMDDRGGRNYEGGHASSGFYNNNDYRDTSSPTGRYISANSNQSAFPTCATTPRNHPRNGSYDFSMVSGVETNLISDNPYGSGGHDGGGYHDDWRCGGPPRYSDDNITSGSRESPPAAAIQHHHPTIKAVVRVDSRGHIETRTVPVIDEYDRYSPRSLYDTHPRSPQNMMTNSNSSNMSPHTLPHRPSLRQSQYWL